MLRAITLQFHGRATRPPCAPAQAIHSYLLNHRNPVILIDIFIDGSNLLIISLQTFPVNTIWRAVGYGCRSARSARSAATLDLLALLTLLLWFRFSIAILYQIDLLHFACGNWISLLHNICALNVNKKCLIVFTYSWVVVTVFQVFNWKLQSTMATVNFVMYS